MPTAIATPIPTPTPNVGGFGSIFEQAETPEEERHSQILILRHTGLSYAELGNFFGVSDRSIGTMLARAGRDFEKYYRRLKGE